MRELKVYIEIQESAAQMKAEGFVNAPDIAQKILEMCFSQNTDGCTEGKGDH